MTFFLKLDSILLILNILETIHFEFKYSVISEISKNLIIIAINLLIFYLIVKVNNIKYFLIAKFISLGIIYQIFYNVNNLMIA